MTATAAPRVLVVPDKFRGSLTAAEAGAAIAAGVHDALPDARVTVLPIADGGEGTADALLAAGGTASTLVVAGPLGAQTRATLIVRGDTAYVEAAQACGLTQTGPGDLGRAVRSSSYGVGQLIRAAADQGAARIVVTLGGSATTDGGFGIAQALGFEMLDRAGSVLGPSIDSLEAVWRVRPGPARLDLSSVAVIAATDVDSPLLGPFGAARVFGPQKGASPSEVELLERRLSGWADALERSFGTDVRTLPGGGAAGGIAAGLAAFAGATITSGAVLVLEILGIPGLIGDAELVITGEGSIDAQTLAGKGPAIVARLARASGAGVLAIAGRADEGIDGPDSPFDRVGQLVHAVRADEGEDPFADAATIARRVAGSLTAEWMRGAQRAK